MRYLIFLCLTSAFLTLFACKPQKHEQQNEIECSPPQGLYVNLSFIDHCDEDDLGGIPFTFLEMNFRDDTTVVLNNGIAKYSLPFKATENPCQYKITHPSSFGEVLVEVTSEGQFKLLKLDDSLNPTPNDFGQKMDSEGVSLSFEHLLNDCLLTGEYTLHKEGKKQPGVITIMANGQLNGMKSYLGYSICLKPECLQKSGYAVIELINQSGHRDAFLCKGIKEKTIIELYAMEIDTIDTKEELLATSKVYVLQAIE